MSSEEESTDLRGSAGRAHRPNASKATGRHNALNHFPKGPECDACELTKTT